MAKETITLTCSRCGKDFQKSFYESGKGATRRLEEKLEWAKTAGFICPGCYKEEQRAKEKDAGLVAEVRASIYHGNTLIFSGDTYPHKDKLKEMGCKWTDEYTIDILGAQRPRKAWVYFFGDEDAEVEKALGVLKKSGAKLKYPNMEEGTIIGIIKKKLKESASE